MKRSRQVQGTLLIAAVAGVMDSLTGLLLWAAPAMTLSLMWIEAAAGSLVYIQFIGAFVLGVGSLYLLGLWVALRQKQWAFLRTVFIATAWIRIVIFLFGMISITSGGLALAWISVPLTDAAVALVQLIWIRKGGVPNGS